VCARLGRPVVGIDDNPSAIAIADERLGRLSVKATLERVSEASPRRRSRRGRAPSKRTPTKRAEFPSSAP